MACYFQAVVDFKRVLLARTLAEHDGNRTRAAQALCLERSHFRRLLRDYGITVPAPRYHWLRKAS